VKIIVRIAGSGARARKNPNEAYCKADKDEFAGRVHDNLHFKLGVICRIDEIGKG
jgi:hypothetical protein